MLFRSMCPLCPIPNSCRSTPPSDWISSVYLRHSFSESGSIPFGRCVFSTGIFTWSNRFWRSEEHTSELQSLGGVDLQLLGIGHNGHIGFNEPGESFDKQVHCVNLTESTIEANKRFFASAEDVPKQAYTMGIKTIMQAKKILIVASGEDKAEIVQKAFFGPITPQVPASVLQLHNDVTLVADEAALSKLSE